MNSYYVVRDWITKKYFTNTENQWSDNFLEAKWFKNRSEIKPFLKTFDKSITPILETAYEMPS